MDGLPNQPDAPRWPSLLSAEVLAALPPPAPFLGYVTGVGSREVPEEAFRLLRTLFTVFYAKGYATRSGGAPGCDDACELGVYDHPHYRLETWPQAPSVEIYLPYRRFNQSRGWVEDQRTFRPGYIPAWLLPNYAQAQAIAKQIHPRGEHLKENHLVMHARNPYQVLGRDLATPSGRLICWAPMAKDGLVTGGTRTAVALAVQHKVICVNVQVPSTFEKVHRYIEQQVRVLTNRPDYHL